MAENEKNEADDMNNESIQSELENFKDSKDSGGKKSKILIILLIILIIASLVGFGMFFGFLNFDKIFNHQTEKSETTEIVEEKEPQKNPEEINEQKDDVLYSTKSRSPIELTYFNLPDITVNLRNKNGFLKIGLVLELNSKDDEKIINSFLPRIIDQLQLFFRDLVHDDFIGSAALTKLKESIEIHINNIISPAKIYNVLINSVLVQ